MNSHWSKQERWKVKRNTTFSRFYGEVGGSFWRWETRLTGQMHNCFITLSISLFLSLCLSSSLSPMSSFSFFIVLAFVAFVATIVVVVSDSFVFFSGNSNNPWQKSCNLLALTINYDIVDCSDIRAFGACLFVFNVNTFLSPQPSSTPNGWIIWRAIFQGDSEKQQQWNNIFTNHHCHSSGIKK